MCLGLAAAAAQVSPGSTYDLDWSYRWAGDAHMNNSNLAHDVPQAKQHQSFPHREREAKTLIYPFPLRKWFQEQKLYIRGHKTNLALVLSGAVGKSLPIPGTEFWSGLTSLIYSLGCCGEALHNWWIWVILMKFLHYWMLCLGLLQPGSIIETFPLLLSISLQNAMQQGEEALIPGSAWMPEIQRMNLAWDLKLCSLKRRGEYSDGGKKKPGRSHFKKM